tara:strand:+ start:938 stop:1543 length:606 start_codon:yes stop_codon:yes gene_type:complete
MATTATPYGFKPLNHVGGTPYAGAVRHIKIASGFGTNIFNGSIVNIVAAGTIEVVTDIGSNADQFPAGVIGVFVGCTYTDPTSKNKTFSNHWPTGTVASDAMAYVVDDPQVLFQVQADASVAQADLGANAPLAAVQSTSTGDTTTGVSTTALDATTAQTATIAFRIVDFVESPDSTVGDAFTDVIVKFNAGQHSYENSTGI